MSTVHGPARNRAVRQAPVEPPLRVVPRAAPQRPRAPFVVLVVALMAVGLIGLLLINTSMQRKAFELTNLQEQAATLQTREQALRLEVDGLSSPDRIATEAGRLGMVPNASPAFLRLEDGEVLGHPRAAMPGTNLPGLSAPPVTSDSSNSSDDSNSNSSDETDSNSSDDSNNNSTDETDSNSNSSDEAGNGSADDNREAGESDTGNNRNDGGDDESGQHGDNGRDTEGGEHR
ncbi:MAG: hypothetical protein ACRDO7_00355 [Nocardioidaceae bacterium]